MSIFATPPNACNVNEILYEIRDSVKTENNDEAAEIATKLIKISNPQFTMDCIVPSIFVDTTTETETEMNDDDDDEMKRNVLKMTNDEAMSLLVFLVTSNGALYLKPASRAVRQVATLLIDSRKEIHVSNHVIQVLVNQLGGNDVEVASNATQALVALCQKTTAQSNYIVLQSTLNAIHQLWQQHWKIETGSRTKFDSTVCMRCASALVDLITIGSKESDEKLLETTTNYLEPLVIMVKENNDPLLQISVLDLMIQLAESSSSSTITLTWLYSKQVLEPVLFMVGCQASNDSNSQQQQNVDPDPILGGTALRLLSCLCRSLPLFQENINDENDDDMMEVESSSSQLMLETSNLLLTNFYHALEKFSSSAGELDRLALLDAISSFAMASNDSLQLVLDHETICREWLSLAVAQPKLKAAILHSVAMVLSSFNKNGKQQQQDRASTALSMRLYSLVGRVNQQRDATELILSLARSSVVELRMGAYAIMKAVAAWGMGIQILMAQLDFYEWLLDRRLESTREGREAKYDVVKVILATSGGSSQSMHLLAEPIVESLKEFQQQGPHYVQVQQRSVATE